MYFICGEWYRICDSNSVKELGKLSFYFAMRENKLSAAIAFLMQQLLTASEHTAITRLC
jgi:hypothetical protein